MKKKKLPNNQINLPAEDIDIMQNETALFMELYEIYSSLDDKDREKFLKELMDFAEEQVGLPLRKKADFENTEE